MRTILMMVVVSLFVGAQIANAGDGILAQIKAVESYPGGIIIRVAAPLGHCTNFPDRVRFPSNSADPDFVKRAMAIVLQSKASGENVAVFLADACDQYNMNVGQGITLGSDVQW